MCPANALRELIAHFERAHQGLVGLEGERLAGVPGWSLAGWSAAQREAWFEVIGYAGSYPVASDGGPIAVELREDEDPSRFTYRCPQSFKRRFVAATEVAVYAPRSAQLLDYLADLLEIPQALRRGIATPAIEGVLWQLGRMRVGEVHLDVWFVRGLATELERVFAHFHTPGLPDQGLILCAGAGLSRAIALPRQYRVIPIDALFVDESDSARIDLPLIHRWLSAAPGTPMTPSHPVLFDALTHTLTISTRPHAHWTIKGDRQRQAVHYLYQASLKDRWWVPAQEILAAVYGYQEGGRSRRMHNLFSGNTDWQNFIISDGHGHYSFDLR